MSILARGRSEVTVTEDKRTRAYNLLWPPDRRPETTHQLLDKFQNLQRSQATASPNDSDLRSLWGLTVPQQNASSFSMAKNQHAQML